MQENVEYVVSAKDLASEIFAKVEKGLKGIGEQATDLKAKVGSLSASLGVGIFAHMIDGAIRSEAELATLGQIAGVSGAKMSGLGADAAAAGTPLNDVATIVAKLSKVVGEAQLGDQSKKSLFTALGINPNDGRDAADRLLQVAKAVTNMTDTNVAAYATSQLLNKSWAEARPFLENLAQQESITARVTNEAVAAAKQYEDGTRKLAYEAGQGKIAFANEWLPAINGVVEAMVRAQKEGGTLQAVIAGIQTTITGTDQYKNDKALVELTERKLSIQAKIEELKRDGDIAMPGAKGDNGPGTLVYWQKQLTDVEGQLKTVLTYRNDLAKPATPGGIQKEDGMNNAAIDDIINGARAEKALRARMEFEKHYPALIAAAQAGGQQFAAVMRANNALVEETYKQGEIDLVESLRRRAANDDAALGKKIASLQEEQALARKKGDVERVQITVNGIAIAEAERASLAFLNRVRIDAALEAGRDDDRLFKQQLMKEIDQLRQETMTIKELENQAYADKLTRLQTAHANELISTAEFNARRVLLETQHQAKLGNLTAQGQLQRRELDQMSGYQQVEFYSQTLATVTSAAAQHNKQFFELNKIANISNAIISTYAGATKALEWGYPLGPIFAGIITAAGVANVAAISAQQFGGGAAAAPAASTFSGNANTGLPTGALPTPIASTQPAAPAVTVNVSFQGITDRDYVENTVIPLIKEAVNSRDAVIIGQNSRQAQVIGDGLG